MNTFEFSRKFAKITNPVIEKIGIDSVLDNEDVILNDSIEANLTGLTFAGNEITAAPPFSDWHETGEYHQGLGFYNNNDIVFTSRGDGFEAIRQTYNKNDYDSPTAKTLKIGTLNKITSTFIKKLKAL